MGRDDSTYATRQKRSPAFEAGWRVIHKRSKALPTDMGDLKIWDEFRLGWTPATREATAHGGGVSTPSPSQEGTEGATPRHGSSSAPAATLEACAIKLMTCSIDGGSLGASERDRVLEPIAKVDGWDEVDHLVSAMLPVGRDREGVWLGVRLAWKKVETRSLDGGARSAFLEVVWKYLWQSSVGREVYERFRRAVEPGRSRLSHAGVRDFDDTVQNALNPKSLPAILEAEDPIAMFVKIFNDREVDRSRRVAGRPIPTDLDTLPPAASSGDIRPATTAVSKVILAYVNAEAKLIPRTPMVPADPSWRAALCYFQDLWEVCHVAALESALEITPNYRRQLLWRARSKILRSMNAELLHESAKAHDTGSKQRDLRALASVAATMDGRMSPDPQRIRAPVIEAMRKLGVLPPKDSGVAKS
jgi:hypothetical protein